jgi:hypothetical protein
VWHVSLSGHLIACNIVRSVDLGGQASSRAAKKLGAQRFPESLGWTITIRLAVSVIQLYSHLSVNHSRPQSSTQPLPTSPTTASRPDKSLGRQIRMPRRRHLVTLFTSPVLFILHPMRDDRLQLCAQVRAMERFHWMMTRPLFSGLGQYHWRESRDREGRGVSDYGKVAEERGAYRLISRDGLVRGRYRSCLQIDKGYEACLLSSDPVSVRVCKCLTNRARNQPGRRNIAPSSMCIASCRHRSL